MPAGYPDFSWSVRVVRMLVVVAVAALSGAVIGGASVYLISDALSPPPPSHAPSRADTNTGNAIVLNATPPAQSKTQPAPGVPNAQDRPIRMIDPAFPPPTPSAAAAPATATAEPPVGSSAASTQNAPAESAQIAAQPAAPAPSQPQPKSWPDALSRAHPDTAAAPETDTQPAVPAPRAAESGPDDGNNNLPAARASNTDENRVATRPTPARQRTVTRTKRPAAQGFAPSAVARTPIYDYYGQGDDRDRQDSAVAPGPAVQGRSDLRDGRAQRSTDKAKPRIVVRQQENSAQSDGEAQRQPTPSFFGGLFGRDRDDDWQRDDRNRR
jgi:hypothetical protein